MEKELDFETGSYRNISQLIYFNKYNIFLMVTNKTENAQLFRISIAKQKHKHKRDSFARKV